MKKVLVTGKSGYIGTKFKEWVEVNNRGVELNFISIRDDSWKDKDFSEYDTVLHLAGIAHVSRNSKLKEMYYNVNRDLTIDLAKKSKNDGVSQFIFMSSIIVYGKNSVGLMDGVIDSNTIPVPNDFYGDSKLQAEKLLSSLEDESFKLAIVRPPMVYGPESKGNFKVLLKIVPKIPIFPLIENKRSMIFIDNLCCFLSKIILNNDAGLFSPQNTKYISTSSLVKEISINMNKNIIFLRNLNFLVFKLKNKIAILEKIFGNLAYDQSLSTYKENYEMLKFQESITRSINKEK